MNNYFVNISQSLNLKDSSESKVDDIGSIIKHSFDDQVSAKKITESITGDDEF